MACALRARMNERGFTLIEVLTATAVLTTAALAGAQLLIFTTHAMRHARVQTSTAALASTRMEQLRALTWTFEIDGSPLSDRSTDLSVSPPAASGTGLSLSPPGALEANTPGFADFLDERGDWVGSGTVVPPAAVFVRRWSVEIPADGAADTLVLQVLVRRVVDDIVSAGGLEGGGRGASRFVTVRTRTVR